MKTTIFRITIWCFALTAGAVALAQKQPVRRVSRAPDDVATLKQKAEAGDAQAKLALGEKLMANARPKDALAQYREIAGQGNAEACYRAGEILLFGVTSVPKDQQVNPRPLEGVRLTYRAATNRHALASRNLGRALLNGIGMKTNRTEAYAWMQHYAETSRSRDRSELDRLALTMDASALREGQKLAKRFKARDWPPLVLSKPPVSPLALKIEGLSLRVGGALVVVNRRSLAVGESTTFQVGQDTIEVRCLEIGEDYTCLEVEGEEEPRRLSFGKI